MTSEIDLFLAAIAEMRDAINGTPASEDDVAAFEQRYQVRLPADVQDYFLRINGVHDSSGFVDIESLSTWCLLTEYFQKWKFEHDPSEEMYFYMGHYDISVWLWLIVLDQTLDNYGFVYVYMLQSDTFTKLADSFSDFLRLYRTQGAESLLGYG